MNEQVFSEGVCFVKVKDSVYEGEGGCMYEKVFFKAACCVTAKEIVY